MLKNFIDRPVLSTVVSIIILILGFLGLTTLPVSQYPDIAPPTIQVFANYPGANAQTVLESVIIPIEEQINGVEGMEYITSTASNNGSAQIRVFFKQGINPDIAAVNVQNRVARANPLLPQHLPAVRQRVEGSLGSGVLVDGSGHIITNHHVIQGADEIRVQLADGRIAMPEIVGMDPDTDLAILRVPIKDPPVMPMGRSDELRAGDVVLAIGNPFGLSQTVTQGIVSATGRGRLGVTDFEDFIQTDAAINFGNSGGALINTQGELIGINTAVLAQNLGTDGISFAIPVNMVRGVMDQILAHGRVRRGWLGVESEEVPRATAAALGIDPPAALRISNVTPRGPAELVGLRRDDLVTHLNGQPILSAQEALNRVAGMAPGSSLNIQARRGAQRLTFNATLEERPPRSSRQAGG